MSGGGHARGRRGWRELQQAVNDYSVGLVVAAVAHSPYAGNTMIFVREDDGQDGPDLELRYMLVRRARLCLWIGARIGLAIGDIHHAAGIARADRVGIPGGRHQAGDDGRRRTADSVAAGALRDAHYPGAPPEEALQILHPLVRVDEACAG